MMSTSSSLVLDTNPPGMIHRVGTGESLHTASTNTNNSSNSNSPADLHRHSNGGDVKMAVKPEPIDDAVRSPPQQPATNGTAAISSLSSSPPTSLTVKTNPDSMHNAAMHSASESDSDSGSDGDDDPDHAKSSESRGGKGGGGKRRKKTDKSSCHQCKSLKPTALLLGCTTKADKVRRKRKCRKRYCAPCLQRTYSVVLAAMTPDEIARWICPACCDTCTCAACQRRTKANIVESIPLAGLGPIVPALGLPAFMAGAGSVALPLPLPIPPVPLMPLHPHLPQARSTGMSQSATGAPFFSPPLLPLVNTMLPSSTLPPFGGGGTQQFGLGPQSNLSNITTMANLNPTTQQSMPSQLPFNLLGANLNNPQLPFNNLRPGQPPLPHQPPLPFSLPNMPTMPMSHLPSALPNWMSPPSASMAQQHQLHPHQHQSQQLNLGMNQAQPNFTLPPGISASINNLPQLQQSHLHQPQSQQQHPFTAANQNQFSFPLPQPPHIPAPPHPRGSVSISSHSSSVTRDPSRPTSPLSPELMDMYSYASAASHGGGGGGGGGRSNEVTPIARTTAISIRSQSNTTSPSPAVPSSSLSNSLPMKTRTIRKQKSTAKAAKSVHPYARPEGSSVARSISSDRERIDAAGVDGIFPPRGRSITSSTHPHAPSSSSSSTTTSSSHRTRASGGGGGGRLSSNRSTASDTRYSRGRGGSSRSNRQHEEPHNGSGSSNSSNSSNSESRGLNSPSHSTVDALANLDLSQLDAYSLQALQDRLAQQLAAKQRAATVMTNSSGAGGSNFNLYGGGSTVAAGASSSSHQHHQDQQQRQMLDPSYAMQTKRQQVIARLRSLQATNRAAMENIGLKNLDTLDLGHLSTQQLDALVILLTPSTPDQLAMASSQPFQQSSISPSLLQGGLSQGAANMQMQMNHSAPPTQTMYDPQQLQYQQQQQKQQQQYYSDPSNNSAMAQSHYHPSSHRRESSHSNAMQMQMQMQQLESQVHQLQYQQQISQQLQQQYRQQQLLTEQLLNHQPTSQRAVSLTVDVTPPSENSIRSANHNNNNNNSADVSMVPTPLADSPNLPVLPHNGMLAQQNVQNNSTLNQQQYGSNDDPSQLASPQPNLMTHSTSQIALGGGTGVPLQALNNAMSITPPQPLRTHHPSALAMTSAMFNPFNDGDDALGMTTPMIGNLNEPQSNSNSVPPQSHSAGPNGGAGPLASPSILRRADLDDDGFIRVANNMTTPRTVFNQLNQPFASPNDANVLQVQVTPMIMRDQTNSSATTNLSPSAYFRSELEYPDVK